MTEAEKAYQVALERIEAARRRRAIGLDFDTPDTRALTELPPEISALDALKSLEIKNTKISDLTAIGGMNSLLILDADGTNVSDLSPLSTLANLQGLSLSITPVNDLGPLSNLERLRTLFLTLTQNLTDLRPIAHLENLSKNGLHYSHCAAVALDPTPGGLQDLVEIEDDEERTTKTLAYLRTLKTWPPVAAPPSTPSPHRAPLMVTWYEDRLVRAPLAPEVEADPARLLQQALDALRNRLADLANLRTTLSNQRPGLARAFSGLDLALAPNLAEINQIDIGEQILRIAGLLPAPGEMLDDQLEDLLTFVEAAQRLARRLPDWVAYLDSDIDAELTAEAVKETMPLLTELASGLREQSWVDDEVARDLDRQIATSQDLPRDARIGKGTQLSMSNVLNAALSGLSNAWTLLK